MRYLQSFRKANFVFAPNNKCKINYMSVCLVEAIYLYLEAFILLITINLIMLIFFSFRWITFLAAL